MIWIVLVLAVLCIAMSCVALWYREKWQEAKESYANMSDLYYEINVKLQKAEFYKIKYKKDNEIILRTMGRAYDMGLRFDGKFDVLVDMLLSQLPKRDSKGRYCKK